LILPSPLPQPAKKAKPIAPRTCTPPPTPPRIQKRPAPDGLDGAQPTKRARVGTGQDHSLNESRRLEEDGLVLLDGDRPADEDVEIVAID
jgi:hypothetical protein